MPYVAASGSLNGFLAFVAGFVGAIGEALALVAEEEDANGDDGLLVLAAEEDEANGDLATSTGGEHYRRLRRRRRELLLSSEEASFPALSVI